MGEVALYDISKQFTLRIDGAVHTVQALSRVSFKVHDGEIVALIGPSGCGKTTALRIAMGLETASGGKVTVDGREVKGCGHDRGMVFQFAELLPWLTALQNVMFGLEMKGMRGAELRATAARYLELVGLSDSLNRRPHQLSGGMKQRVGIARALAIDPKVLLMDEPFGALDAQTRETMQAELLELHARTRKTILVVRDEQNGLARARMQFEQFGLHGFARLRVERAERLVHEQYLGIDGKRARNPDALLHPAGELVGSAVERVGEADER